MQAQQGQLSQCLPSLQQLRQQQQPPHQHRQRKRPQQQHLHMQLAAVPAPSPLAAADDRCLAALGGNRDTTFLCFAAASAAVVIANHHGLAPVISLVTLPPGLFGAFVAGAFADGARRQSARGARHCGPFDPCCADAASVPDGFERVVGQVAFLDAARGLCAGFGAPETERDFALIPGGLPRVLSIAITTVFIATLCHFRAVGVDCARDLERAATEATAKDAAHLVGALDAGVPAATPVSRGGHRRYTLAEFRSLCDSSGLCKDVVDAYVDEGGTSFGDNDIYHLELEARRTASAPLPASTRVRRERHRRR